MRPAQARALCATLVELPWDDLTIAQAITETKSTESDALIAYFEKQTQFDIMKSRKAYFRAWDHQLVQEAYPFTVKPKGQAKDKWDFLKFGEAVPAQALEAPDTTVNASFLLGDTNGDGSVNAGDIGQTKSQSGNAVTASNFREDVTADGNINASDIGLVKSKSGTALP